MNMNVADRVYGRLFGHSMGRAGREFWQHLQISVVALTVANGLLFGAMVVAGRLLGPFQFGVFTLVWSIAQILWVPMMFGMDTAVLHGLSVGDGKGVDKRQLASSALVLLLITTLVITIVGFTLGPRIAVWLGLEAVYIRLGVLLALTMSIKLFLDAILRGEGRFTVQAVSRITFGTVVLGGVLTLVLAAQMRNYVAVVGPLVVGAVLAAGVSWWGGAGRWLALRYVRREEMGRLWRFMRVGALYVNSSGALLFTHFDKVIIEGRLGVEAVGIYGAYFLLSVTVANQLAYMFLNAFVPAASRQKDKRGIWRKLDKLAGLGWPVVWLLFVAGIGLGLVIFSDKYPLQWGLVALMAAYATAFLVWQAYSWLIVSEGKRGVVYIGMHGVLAGVVYLLVLYVLLPVMGLYAPGIAFGVSMLYGAGTILHWRRRRSRV